MSEEATLDEFASTEEEESDDIEKPELIQGVAWSTLKSVPEEWAVNNVESDIDILSGNNFSSEYFVEEGGVPLIRIRDLAEDETTVNFDGDYDSRYLINQQDLLVGMDGEFEPHLWAGPQALLNQRVCKIEPKSRYNKIFFRYAIEKPLFYIQKSIAGTTVKHLSQSNINDLNIPTPPLPEQRKIATVLYTVDRAIDNAEEIETQLQRVKKGATQKLFTYGLNNQDTQSHHIGDFPQSWEFDKVSNLAEIERGNTPRTSHDEYYGGEIAWVTPDDLSDLNEDGNGKYISDSGRKLTPEGLESSSLTVVEPDSVMFTSRSYGIGRTAICTVPAATNQGITAFECGESLETEFFYYYLNYIMDYVVSISGGSTFPEISKSATGNIDVPVPGIEEQKEIASLLSQFDEQILHNREVTSQLKRLKRGLLQDLLSGTVRTTDTNIEVPEEIATYG